MVVINFIVHNVTNKAESVSQFAILCAVSFLATIVLAVLSYKITDYVTWKLRKGKL